MRNFRAAGRRHGCKTVSGILGLVCLAGAVSAQEVNVVGKNVTLLGIPSATVAPNGTLFGSLAGSTKRDGIYDEVDGSAELGLGFGSARA